MSSCISISANYMSSPSSMTPSSFKMFKTIDALFFFCLIIGTFSILHSHHHNHTHHSHSRNASHRHRHHRHHKVHRHHRHHRRHHNASHHNVSHHKRRHGKHQRRHHKRRGGHRRGGRHIICRYANARRHRRHARRHHRRHHRGRRGHKNCNNLPGVVWNSKLRACYLVLKKNGPNDNFSTYIVPASKPWGPNDSNVKTIWSKVRIDPKTLLINTGDFNYTNSTGFCSHWKTVNPNQIPYGRALDCAAPYSHTGTGKIDLSGTQFSLSAVANNTFKAGGYMPAYTSVLSNGNQVNSFTGGGYCGWVAPASIVGNEYLVHLGGWDIQLALVKSNTTSHHGGHGKKRHHRRHKRHHRRHRHHRHHKRNHTTTHH